MYRFLDDATMEGIIEAMTTNYVAVGNVLMFFLITAFFKKLFQCTVLQGYDRIKNQCPAFWLKLYFLYSK